MSVSTLDLLNSRIDLSDVLSRRAAQAPNFVGLFDVPRSGDAARFATNPTHYWLEGVDAPKTKTFTGYDYESSAATFTVASSVGWQVGDLFHVLGDSAVLRVASVASTSIGAELVAANGSSLDLETYAPTNGGVLVFDSRPIQEGSDSGENFFAQSTAEFNYSQIFRGDVGLTGTALAVETAGRENNIATQLDYATDAILRRINAALVFGTRAQRTAASPGSMGGLYFFGTQEGGLGRSYSDSPLTMSKINLAARDVTDAGRAPDVVLCGPGQAQVISSFMDSQVRIQQGTTEVGSRAETIVTSACGSPMKIVVEPSLPDSDVWVCDSRGFALLPLNGRALRSEPASAPGVDGARAVLIGEYVAEFKNAKQALCRISGLKSSASVLGQ
ncbi:MAG: DUF5309 family protein [Thermoguttaceae bacterium]|nr:DUF5309 family protein [Thermoguttaceae bacterium]